MLYQRFAATAAVLLLLGGCSFFDFWSAADTPAKLSDIDSHGASDPLEGVQMAALPGYQSDQNVMPAGIEAIRGFVGIPSARPARAAASIPVQPLAQELTLKDLLPQPQVLDLQPIAAGFEPDSFEPDSFEPDSFSLADLIADQDWRRRTAETLGRLFQ